MKLTRLFTGIAFCFFFATAVLAQDDYLTGLRSNAQLKQYHLLHPEGVAKQGQFFGKYEITDTLALPFFDDFSYRSIFPNDSVWADNSVYINTDFGILPPSIGVATMDGLDNEGNAYGLVDPNIFGAADTLTSQPIDLAGLSIADSIFLSFFYQAQGESFEQLEQRDSLVLQFRSTTGAWVTVWSTRGIPRDAFKLAMVKMTDANFLHGIFQFRFINYLRYIGNLKQWHLDYVYMNKGRTFADTIFDDQNVVYKPENVLRTYQTMPYAHFSLNPGKYINTTFQIDVSNLGKDPETFSIGTEVTDGNGNVFGSSVLNGQAVPAASHSFFFNTITPNIVTPVQDTFSYTIQNFLGNISGGNFKSQNDTATRKVLLDNYFAYDDGTAESGYGIRNGPGKVAYRFELEKDDTLQAISVHFTQAEAKVINGFTLAVWQTISPLGDPNTANDQLIYTQQVLAPQYTDSINGFHLFILDTAQFLPAGQFFIGWIQTGSYLLNVGWDRNYRYNDQDTVNPNLFYNARGSWQRASVNGTLMMRPYVGKHIEAPLSVPQLPAEKAAFRIYPNPAGTLVYLGEEAGENSPFVISGIAGNTVLSGVAQGQQIDVSALANGIYFIRLETSGRKQFATQKLFIYK